MSINNDRQKRRDARCQMAWNKNVDYNSPTTSSSGWKNDTLLPTKEWTELSYYYKVTEFNFYFTNKTNKKIHSSLIMLFSTVLQPSPWLTRLSIILAAKWEPYIKSTWEINAAWHQESFRTLQKWYAYFFSVYMNKKLLPHVNSLKYCLMSCKRKK